MLKIRNLTMRFLQSQSFLSFFSKIILQSIKYPFQCFITNYKCPNWHLLLLFGNRCVWCQTTVHDDCLSSLSDDLCDLGEFRSVIIPPYYLYQVNKLRRRHPDEYSKVRIYSQTSVKQTFFFSFSKVLAVHRGWFVCQSIVQCAFKGVIPWSFDIQDIIVL